MTKEEVINNIFKEINKKALPALFPANVKRDKDKLAALLGDITERMEISFNELSELFRDPKRFIEKLLAKHHDPLNHDKAMLRGRESFSKLSRSKTQQKAQWEEGGKKALNAGRISLN